MLVDAFYTGVVKVVFRKANGEIREMDCTLKPEILPETTQESNHTSGETMVVYDLDKSAWRSFRLDRVISWSIYEV